MALSPADESSAVSNNGLTAARAKAQVALDANQPSKPMRDLTFDLNAQVRDKYVKGKELGSGTYAVVYKAHLVTDPSQVFAIKKIKFSPELTQDGVGIPTIREISLLQELSHPNIIALRDVFASKDQGLNLVLEFLPMGDLEMLIRDKNVHYGLSDTKAWMGMLCRAVWFCHENFVLHRDIKPNNLLIAADGEVKLADFGLARNIADPRSKMSHDRITRWYRPPELFYKARFYSGAVDIWSVGAVFAELLIRYPFMMGNTDLEQLDKICQRLGTPTESNWPGVSQLEAYVPVAKPNIRPVPSKADLTQMFGTAGAVGVDLISQMFRLDPRKRPTAKQVLEHDWWKTDPKPSKKEDLPRKREEKRMGEDLKRRGGELEGERGPARRLVFEKK